MRVGIVRQGFGKGACSCRSCSTRFSQRCCVCRKNASPLITPSRTAWCNSNERSRKGKRRGARHGSVTPTDRGRIQRSRYWGEMLYADDAGTIAITLRPGEDDNVCRDCMGRFSPEGPGGQDGDNVSANGGSGEHAFHRHRSRPSVQTIARVCALGAGLSA